MPGHVVVLITKQLSVCLNNRHDVTVVGVVSGLLYREATALCTNHDKARRYSRARHPSNRLRCCCLRPPHPVIPARHDENERSLKSNLSLCNETLHMVAYLTSDPDIQKVSSKLTHGMVCDDMYEASTRV